VKKKGITYENYLDKEQKKKPKTCKEIAKSCKDEKLKEIYLEKVP